MGGDAYEIHTDDLIAGQQYSLTLVCTFYCFSDAVSNPIPMSFHEMNTNRYTLSNHCATDPEGDGKMGQVNPKRYLV